MNTRQKERLIGVNIAQSGNNALIHQQRFDLPVMALGATNALANAGLVAALTSLPAILVFPFYSAFGLVFTAVAARLMFGERISRLERLGIVVAVAAVALVNLQ